mmetsp:Transcript_28626/g.70861  ORF Transcript_28626/g.70861 Transcript_28626/m.70861 type:complete len:135 (+) Transcript_28626:89-493(+)
MATRRRPKPSPTTKSSTVLPDTPGAANHMKKERPNPRVLRCLRLTAPARAAVFIRSVWLAVLTRERSRDSRDWARLIVLPVSRSRLDSGLMALLCAGLQNAELAVLWKLYCSNGAGIVDGPGLPAKEMLGLDLR